MEKTKTVREVLEEVVEMLNEIKVPMSEIDAIGIPIARSINGINACLGAMATNEQRPAEEVMEEPGIELISDPSSIQE